jgi:NAD(P)H-dependent FMN reductase
MSNTAARVLVLATSLSDSSRSRVLARFAQDVLRERGITAEWIDLRDLGDLPQAGSAAAREGTAALVSLRDAIQDATHMLFAVPVYNFAPSAAAKNVVELMGEKELAGKTVGFLCAAGGARSYMSILPLANSLMLDFRCWIVPRFVYATSGDIKEGEIVSEDVRHRIGQLLTEMFERTPPVRESP